MHIVLERLFGDLERHGISWTLLRVPSHLAAPTGDVDILVASEDVTALRAAARRAGFVTLPGWTSPPNLILLRYDAPSDHWLVLDVVTDLVFRRPPGWRLPDAASGVLGRRRLHDGVAIPADPDAFWLLVLHCLLDRGHVAAHYRPTLRMLAPSSAASPLASAVVTAAGPAWPPAAFTDAALSEDWGRLEALGERLAADLRRRRSSAERARATLACLSATARKPLLLPLRRGFSVALLGPNGVGKSTVADLVGGGFPLETRVVHMGLWKTSGRQVPGLLAALARPFRIWRRYLLAYYHQLQGRLVIFDRYVYEAYLPAKPPFKALKQPYFWLLAHAVPRPGATVVLDVPGAIAYGRKRENPPDELDEERMVYRRLAQNMPGVKVIDASRELAAVRADVTAIVWRQLVRRWAGPSEGASSASAGPTAVDDG